MEFTKKVRDLQRKVEELTDDVKMTEEANMDLKSEKSRLQVQLEELRNQLRTQLNKYMNELSNPADRQQMQWQASQELLKTYTDKEREMNLSIEKKERTVEEQRKKVKALKRYGREVKYLAEDWAPRGQPLPDILALPPPVSLDDDDQEDDYMRRQ